MLAFRKLEIPVNDISHFRSIACKGALGIYAIFRHVLMAEIALISVTFFRLAVFNRTLADDLTAIEEAAGLCIIELLGNQFFQPAVFIKSSYEFICFLPVGFFCVSQS